MNKKRHVLVLVLVFCLTAALFIVASTGYDPWVDYDEDGYVGSADFSKFAGEYGSSGDPTKNVNITNWETMFDRMDCNLHVKHCYTTNYTNYELPPESMSGFYIDVAGYRQIYLYLWIDIESVEVTLCWGLGEPTHILVANDKYPHFTFIAPGGNADDNSVIFEFDVVGKTLLIETGNPTAQPINVWLHWYVTA